MTVSQLNRSMDRRFATMDHRLARRFATIDRRFAAIDRRFAAVDRRFDAVDRRFERVERSIVDLRVELRAEIARSAEETRRHFDVVVESLRDDLRIFADAIGLQTDRLNRHETRITALEHRALG